MINGESVFDLPTAMRMMWKSLIITKENPMSIDNKDPREMSPTHPGEMLREDFMPDYCLTTAALADALGVSRQTINEILRERRAVSPAMALRLSRLFGNTPEFWLNAQRAYDLWQAQKSYRQDIEKIKPMRAA
jgi:addiction module HigA family antidote